MMSSDTGRSNVDPRILGARIQEARKVRGLSQQQAAEALGVSRPTYIAVEKGVRPVSPEELVRLAEIYGRTVNEILRRQEPVRDFVSHFRAAASRSSIQDPELEKAVKLLQQLCEDYLYLEEQTASPLPRNYPVFYRVEGRDAVDAGEEVADAERMRLGLGSRPAPDLRGLLEADVGIRIFCVDLPTRISGLFLFGEVVGACIALQQKHPPGRRLWSLAHEYGHFLVHRFEAEVTVPWNSQRRPEKERFADSFARSFLMPRVELRRRFHDLKKAGASVTIGDLLTLADSYSVSLQAMLLRLEELKLIPAGTWESLEGRRFKVSEARSLVGLPDPAADGMLPQRYINLAVQAFDQEMITEGELMRFLHTDREGARETVQRMTRRPDVSREGEPGELTLDLAWSPELERATA
ncbi:MAG TPA: XRE family transcriptional regulator [Armatimonadota bacterium]|nr:XRE family transcriptional regulator [Armatimonadota bacterium]